MECELKISDLSMSIGAQKIFSRVSLEIERNKVNAIVGPSGCGKSSFLSCLNQLSRYQKKAFVTGSILWNGQDIVQSKNDLNEIRRNIAMLFQQPSPFPTTIEKNLLIPIKEHFNWGQQKRREKLEQALDDVGLLDEVKDKLNSNALDLSGGQKQRLCLARALVLSPKVILMDEPCSALDPLSTEKIEELMVNLKEAVTIIVVTHNLSQAKRVSDNIAVFWHEEKKGGYIEERGKTSSIFQSPTSPITQRYIKGLAG